MQHSDIPEFDHFAIDRAAFKSHRSYHDYEFPTLTQPICPRPNNGYEFSESSEISDLALTNTEVPESKTNTDSSHQPKNACKSIIHIYMTRAQHFQKHMQFSQ